MDFVIGPNGKPMTRREAVDMAEREEATKRSGAERRRVEHELYAAEKRKDKELVKALRKWLGLQD